MLEYLPVISLLQHFPF